MKDSNKLLLDYMTDAERNFIGDVLRDKRFSWSPLPGPQTMAYESEADIIGYGGAAGGGKTDLACGKALTQHKKTMILRRESTQLVGIIDRIEEIAGDKDGYNGQKNIWKFDGRQIEFGSVPHLGDETKYQGRPHDLLVFDETSNFLEAQVRFLLGWLRSTDPNQKCQALFAFNPPTTGEGEWVIDFFAPWLDEEHPNPAMPGELRWFATIAEKDIELPDSRPFILDDDNNVVYDFDIDLIHVTELIKPMSRTFIPSRVIDNPHLANTGYMRQLQALPEPLRSQMLNGDFKAGRGEDAYQVIPTAWVKAAVARWKSKDVVPRMTEVGVDVARGGKDETVIMCRHGNWYAEPLAHPGKETPNGPITAGLIMAASRDGCPQNVELNGVGVSPVDFLADAGQPVTGVDVSCATTSKDIHGRLSFFNVRSWLWWKMRDDLDPANNKGIALPPNKKLIADLVAPRWKLQGGKIRVEPRDDIIKRTGRSPDYGTACMLAGMEVVTMEDIEMTAQQKRAKHDPYKAGSVHDSNGRGYNPYE